jgi:cytochrome bd-type quinol oxidase subunit 2
MGLIWAWLGVLVLLAIAGVALYRYQKADKWSNRIIAAVTAFITGVFGIVLLAGLVFG